MENLPIVGGFGVVALVIAYRLLTERSEIRDLRKDINHLRDEFERLKGRYDWQRHRAHVYREAITKMTGFVDTAAMLTSQAVLELGRIDEPSLDAIKKALGPVADVLGRLHADVEAVLAASQNEPDEPE